MTVQNRLLAVILSAVLMISCRPPIPPAPPPPPPAVRTVAIIVENRMEQPLRNATCTIDQAPAPRGPSNEQGYIAWDGIAASRRDLQLSCSAEGYLESSEHRVLKTDGNEDLAPILLTERVVRLPGLVVRGSFFWQETGARFTAIEASDFNLFARFIAGENIEPILTQRSEVGFNLLRVWTYYDLQAPPPIGRLIPSEHADYYTQLIDFLNAAARHGLYIELTAYVQPELVDPSHWTHLVNAARESATRPLLELVNEWDQHPFDLTPFPRPTGVLTSHGSNGSESAPVLPHWDYAVFHTNSAFEWWRKVGHNAMEQGTSSVPVLANENTRYPDNDDSLRHAYDAAAGAALLAAGSCFHSISGKPSVLWTGLELEAAKAWVAGARSVRLECQDGPYVHRADLERPGDLRIYQRGNDDRCLVRIRQ